MKLITGCLSDSSFSPASFAKLLIVLNKPMMEELLNHPQFSPSLLEECIVQSIFQTLTKRNTYNQILEYSGSVAVAPTIQSEELLLVSVDCLMKHIRDILQETDTSSTKYAPYLTRGLVWVLIAQSQLSFDFKLTNEVSIVIMRYALRVLSMECGRLPYCDTISMESSLDLCSLVSKHCVLHLQRLIVK